MPRVMHMLVGLTFHQLAATAPTVRKAAHLLNYPESHLERSDWNHWRKQADAPLEPEESTPKDSLHSQKRGQPVMRTTLGKEAKRRCCPARPQQRFETNPNER